jgi:hypothetical protein
MHPFFFPSSHVLIPLPPYRINSPKLRNHMQHHLPSPCPPSKKTKSIIKDQLQSVGFSSRLLIKVKKLKPRIRKNGYSRQ